MSAAYFANCVDVSVKPVATSASATKNQSMLTEFAHQSSVALTRRRRSSCAPHLRPRTSLRGSRIAKDPFEDG